MPQHPPADQWRSAVWRTLTLRLAVRWSVVYCFAWGIVALAVRVLVTDTATWLWWGGLGLIAVWAAAAWAARRRVPTAERAEALLDRSNRSGGLLMAGRFTGHEEWAATLAPARVPRVTWRGGPTAGALALAAAFAVAALLVPMPDPATASGSLDVDRSLDEMAEQIDTLEEEKVLDADEAEALREAMRQVAEDATGNDPGKTWEALDHLAETVDRAGDEAAELARQRMEEAAGAEALARALADGVGQSGPGGEAGAGEAGEPMEGAGGEAMLTPEQMAAAMGALEQLMQDAAGEPTLDGMQLPEGLAEALQQAGMDGGQDGAQEGGAGLSPEQLQRLAEAMQGRQEQLAELMQALQEAGLGEGGEGSASSEYDPYAELAEIDPEALKEFLAGEGMPGGPRRGGDVAGDAGPGPRPRRYHARPRPRRHDLEGPVFRRRRDLRPAGVAPGPGAGLGRRAEARRLAYHPPGRGRRRHLRRRRADRHRRGRRQRRRGRGVAPPPRRGGAVF